MQIENYLFFNGNCEDALAFYAQALGGKTVALMRGLAHGHADAARVGP